MLRTSGIMLAAASRHFQDEGRSPSIFTAKNGTTRICQLPSCILRSRSPSFDYVKAQSLLRSSCEQRESMILWWCHVVSAYPVGSAPSAWILYDGLWQIMMVLVIVFCGDGNLEVPDSGPTLKCWSNRTAERRMRIWQRKGPNTWGKTINDDFKGPGPLMKEPQDVFSRFFWLMIVSSNFFGCNIEPHRSGERTVLPLICLSPSMGQYSLNTVLTCSEMAWYSIIESPTYSSL